MHQLFRRIGLRTGISFGLIVLVASVVIVARVAGGVPRPDPHQVETDPRPSIAATVGDDAAVAPTPSAYADDAALRSAASTFTATWLRRTIPAAEWLDGLRPLSTLRLINLLAGVDPRDVPAVETPGQPVVLLRSDQYAQVRIPINSEAVLLGMVKQGDRWLVDSLDQDNR
jgi:hypothetical protein